MKITWLIMLYCCFIAAAQTNISRDESALLALKAHITSDPHNLIFPNWSTTTHICYWAGVTCGTRHLRVAALNLSNFDLQGTLPPQLGNLSFLVYINLINNSFTGPLPEELSRLRRLKFISLGVNKFMGTIPTWFGSFPNLQKLSLYGNKFTGSIPTSMFNLSRLQIIDLRYNQLSGSIPREIGNLTSLKEIYLDFNNFNEIPNEIGSLDQLEQLFVQENGLEGNVPMVVFNMSSLITLTFYGNNLKGELPDDICRNLPHIQTLAFNRNQLEGSLPTKYWHCEQLVYLGLEANMFSGHIPKNIGNATQLDTIILKKNNLTGSIPTSMFNLSRLQIIDLRYNQLSGSIPREIGNLTSLKEVYLNVNNFNGTIPYEIGFPNLMEVISLDSNHLNGHIPASIFNMSKVTVITLSINQLSGNLPPNIGLNLPNLRKLYLGGNDLSGEIPKSISNASQLQFLDLGNNSLSGFIPSTVCDLANLEVLSLFANSFAVDTSTQEANVLYCLPNLKKLSHLAFGSNPLNVELPVSFFRNLSTSLQRVYMYDCNLRGNIPDEIGNMSSLIILNMDGNSLSGSIPTSLGNLRNLQVLTLGGNELQGQIPDELCQLQNLNSLYLDGNRLSGSIPSCLGQSLTSLGDLDLSFNLLNSTIPSTFWRITNILRLNLSSNNLIGPVSEDVGNLRNAILIDLSNNHFSGSIPSSIGKLQMLQNLSLDSNNLEGLIPSSLGKSLSLVVLNLSNNNLSGIIPKSLESLKYLISLNLSFNKLQGEIPTGGPFRNFFAESFVSNGKLCGISRFHVPACNNHSSKSSRSKLKYIIIGILSGVFVVTAIWIVILRRRKNVDASKEAESLPQLSWRRVSHIELVRATNEFDESNLLGSGGFGSVYKGTFPDGIQVAVKVFNLQLEGAFKSFSTECGMLANIRHRNLIKIISCCSQPDFKAVVLNYMPKGSLEKWLYSQNLCLNILQRLSIMIDVASALEYLHHDYETIIVHCDLKPSNILLDEDVIAHVADFGIAKLLGGRDLMTQTITQATIGYMAPEYGMEGIVTRRGDVYSFGIVLMETFTGKKPTDEMFDGELSLKQWVATSSLLDVVDARLQLTEANDRDFMKKSECLSSIMSLALECSANSPDERVNMQEVVATLNKIKLKSLSEGAEDVGLNGSHV